MTRNASQTPSFECLIFFFARKIRPSTKQIIFKKHCINATTHNNKLHMLYQKAMKINMYEMMNLVKTFDSVPQNFL